jgi:hypothetical protein
MFLSAFHKKQLIEGLNKTGAHLVSSSLTLQEDTKAVFKILLQCGILKHSFFQYDHQAGDQIQSKIAIPCLFQRNRFPIDTVVGFSLPHLF